MTLQMFGIVLVNFAEDERQFNLIADNIEQFMSENMQKGLPSKIKFVMQR